MKNYVGAVGVWDNLIYCRDCLIQREITIDV